MKKSLLLAWALLGLCSTEGGAQIYSQNAVGYHTVQTCTNGLFMIANSLNNGGNELNRVLPLPDWADGSTLFKYDAAVQSYRDSATFIAGLGWLHPEDPNISLSPGEGAFLIMFSNSVPASAAITFVGEVPRQTLCQAMPGNNNIFMWSPPFGRGLEALNPRDGDTAYFYDCSPAPDYSVYSYLDGFGWLNVVDPSPQGRTIPPGVSLWLQLSGAVRNACWPCFTCTAGPALSAPGGLLLSNPAKTGSTFTFEFNSQTNVDYQVQFTSAANLSGWSNLGAPIKAGSTQTIVTDPNATTPLRFYRVLETQ